MNKNILILGGSGTLGSAFKTNFFFSNSKFPTKKKLDITDQASLINYLKKVDVNIIINCAALARMKKCEKNKKLARKINIYGVRNIVNAIKKTNKNIKLIHISSDAVYASLKGGYSERSKKKPYNFYGVTKALAEKEAKKHYNHIIIRTRFFDKNKIFFNCSATDSFSSSIEVKVLVKYIKALIKKKFIGIINIGGKKISDYLLYRKYNKKLKKCLRKDIQKKLNFTLSKDASMNCLKQKKILQW